MWSTARSAVVAGLLVGAASGCTDIVVRDVPGPGTFVPPPTVAPEAAPPPLKVTAGPDLFVSLPERALRLLAYTSGAYGGSSVDIRWSKLTGPASYRIVGADGYEPEISGLEKGRYTFLISVTDRIGRAAADTVAIHVLDSASVQAVDFPGQLWFCPMGCTVSIANINGRVPDGALMRVQLRSGNETSWEEVRAVWGVREQYFYSISDGRLVLYSNDEPPPVDVRVLWAVP